MDGTNISRAGTISMVLADDNRLFREGLARLIAQELDLRIVAIAADSDALEQAVQEERPDVVLLDFGLVNGDSLRLTEAVRRTMPATKVMVMGLLPRRQDIADLVRAGAAGFLMKDASFKLFVSTIRAVAAGEQVLPSELTGSLFDQIADIGSQNPNLILEGVRITAREHQIIDLVSQGLTNKEIGSRLRIATSTVKCHVHNVLEKLALRSRFEMAESHYPNERPSASQ